MALKIPLLLLLAGSLILPVAAQQKPDKAWDVIGGYVCSQDSDHPSSEMLYLLPDMTWSRVPPFTSFASRSHPNFSWSRRKEEDLPDWVQETGYVMQHGFRYKVPYNRWRPRTFSYDGDVLRLYIADPPAPIWLRSGLQRVGGMALFRRFKVDAISQELHEIRVVEDPQTLLLCRPDSLF